MIRKVTRNYPRSVFAAFVPIVTLLIAAAVLAQVTGTRRPSGRAKAVSVPAAVSAPAQAEPVSIPGPDGARRFPIGRSHMKRRGSALPNAPLFLPVVTYFSGGLGPRAIAVGDVNSDGKPDLVVANACAITGCSNSEAMGVLLGNGDGTFQAAATYGSGGTVGDSIGLVIADLNGDGKLDLVVTNACGGSGDCTSGSVGVLLGNGDGTFQGAVTYPSGGWADTSVAVGDVNGDGKPDLLVANFCADISCGGNGVVGVLLGEGDGTFSPVVTYNSGGIIAESAGVGDLNRDGKLDVLVENNCNSDCTKGLLGVLLGNGDGTFRPAVTYDSSAAQRSVVVADVNGNGYLDVVVSSRASDTVDVLLGNGDGTFRPAMTYGSGGHDAFSVAAIDVNSDGAADLLVANRCSDVFNCGRGNGLVGVLLGNGDGTFQTAVTYDSGGQDALAIAVADVNGDDRPDLLVANNSNNVGVLMNNVGTPATTTTLVSSMNPAALKQVVTYTATVTSQSGGQATGTVTFRDGGSIAATVTLASNQAAYSAKYTVTGTHAITATYSGDLQNAGSTSATLTEYIGSFPVSSVTVLTTSGSPSIIGQSVTFTATVAPRKARYGTLPDGELVTFHDGTATIGSAALASGVAVFTTSSFSARVHNIRAHYSGDALFKASDGGVAQVVEKYPTTTSLKSSPNPSQFGEAVIFTAHVRSTGAAPTGKVKFLDGTTAIGSATLNGNGVAKLTKSTLAVGTHPITVQYLGDATSDKSTSSVVNQVVQ